MASGEVEYEIAKRETGYVCLLGGSSRGALRAPFFSAGPLGAACECNATSGCSPQRLIWAPLWGRETNVQKKLFLLHLAYFGPM